ncbi:MAG: hypothetical protein IKE29_08460 [Paenibacillus sp.]|uniref:hypothetical protein n=1 Tax=Paenibacillus sp. TaxID=58172 RepID=UPI0025F32021|nr:hypothetical protein [Paenibacillus sp.]MBR2564638.1 hypothetical protein [Paenibacillus sp.]
MAVCTIEVHTITERAGQTEEAERSHLSTDFHFGKVNGKNPGIMAIWSCPARGEAKSEQSLVVQLDNTQLE